jgi:2,4-dienoyl-CoA reductase-like NADH-dependent reductase (Old Yellow Enzyme family)
LGGYFVNDPEFLCPKQQRREDFMELKKLFEPIKIGKLNVRNRIVAAPTLPCLAMPDGHASRELIEYYKAKAKGGAGIVTVGESAVDREYAVTHAGQLILDSDKFIPS